MPHDTDARVTSPHLTYHEQGIKEIWGKRYRWERDTPTSPLRLVPVVEKKVESIEIPQALVRRVGEGERA